jgi:hypothetical protein
MPEHPTSRIRLERLGSVAILRLAAPERLNAVSRDDQKRLREIWDEVRTDPDIRCAVVTGEGRAFCAGAHMGSLAAHAANGANQPETFSSFTPRLPKVFKPIITAVNGICTDAGLHFIVDSDIIIVSENASFTDPHVGFGQVSGQEPAGLLRKIPVERSCGWSCSAAPSALMRRRQSRSVWRASSRRPISCCRGPSSWPGSPHTCLQRPRRLRCRHLGIPQFAADRRIRTMPIGTSPRSHPMHSRDRPHSSRSGHQCGRHRPLRLTSKIGETINVSTCRELAIIHRSGRT